MYLSRGDVILVKDSTYGIVHEVDYRNNLVDYMAYGASSVWCSQIDNCKVLKKIHFTDINKYCGEYAAVLDMRAISPNVALVGKIIGESPRMVGCMMEIDGNIHHLNMGSLAIYVNKKNEENGGITSGFHRCQPINMGFNHLNMICPICNKEFPELNRVF